MNKRYTKGFHDGISIGLGYFSVSFSFGILAIQGGLSSSQSTLMSMLTLTSAGQFAGLDAIITGANIISIIIAQFIINSRYILMSLSLSQNLDSSVNTFKRSIIAFFNTDEIFAVAIGQKEKLTLSYMAGLATPPWFGWSFGTFLGSISGSFLPLNITAALGLALFAMFIAIVTPKCIENKNIRSIVFISIILSLIIYMIPALKQYSVIICTATASAIGALLYPIKDEEENI